jgi:multimeric flavodoxin WrbA
MFAWSLEKMASCLTGRGEGYKLNVIIISSSPNKDGLTAACVAAVNEGILTAGGNTELICLNDLKISSCEACDHGWGTCLNDHACQVLDNFQDLHRRTCQSDALVLVTPVYWGEMSESAKAFTDRIRRCEATRNQESGLYQKPVIAIAAAGGSGNGMITCLSSMERWIEHVRARKFDLIPVNRWSRDYKIQAIRAAGAAMVIKGMEATW